jgi:hypothetical protein
MHLDMHQALRCCAKSKRSGLRCQAPAIRGREVCRMHGARGGAPKGNRNALKHGDFAAICTSSTGEPSKMKASRSFSTGNLAPLMR